MFFLDSFWPNLVQSFMKTNDSWVGLLIINTLEASFLYFKVVFIFTKFITVHVNNLLLSFKQGIANRGKAQSSTWLGTTKPRYSDKGRQSQVCSAHRHCGPLNYTLWSLLQHFFEKFNNVYNRYSKFWFINIEKIEKDFKTIDEK